MKWTPKDILAFIVTISCLTMIALGLDTWIKYTLLVVTGLYFGVDIATIFNLIKAIKEKKEGK